jgi:transposase InsO family protein
MSAKGNPYDNAFMESFYKTLKYEEVVCCECTRGRIRGRNASSKMREGPSESACRSRFQTATSCAGQEPDVVNVVGKGGVELRQV